MSAYDTKRIVLVSASALALFLGAVPQHLSWDEGLTTAASVQAAGGRGGHSSHDSGGGHEDGGDHDDGGAHDDSHDHDDEGGDSNDHEDGDEGHGSSQGGKGKGPRYRGGRPYSGKGRGGASSAVVELIFEHR